MNAAIAVGGSPAADQPWLVRLDRAVGWLVEVPASIAVLAEVCILLVGIFFRFILDQPLVWSDELATITFLWLSMLGAVVALRRGEHMRLTTVAALLPVSWWARAEALAVLGPMLFLVLIFRSSFDYAQDQMFVTTPAMGWPDTVRSAALPVGFALMLLVCVVRLLRSRISDVVVVAACLAAVAGALWLGGPALRAIGNWNLVIFFIVVLAAAVLAGLPIAFAFSLCTMAYLLTTTSTPLMVVAGRMDEGMSSLILLAVPLFVMLGALIEITGMARTMVEFLASLLGHVRGGLSYVLLSGMLLVSGISGAKTADMAAIAPVLFPEMKRRGGNPGEMVSLLAASGAMAETIPPSLVLIAIGSVTGISISALFTGGLLPGVVLAIALAILARFRATDFVPGAIRRASMKTVLSTLVVAFPALILPFIIRAAVVEGVATATEVSTIGIVYTVVVGILVYRRFDWRRVYPMLVETASLSGAILFIIGSATGMAWALTQSGFSHALAETMAGVPGGATGFLLISIVVFIVLGSVLEGIPAMVLFGPLLFPIARELGVHEVHYAIVIILAMGIGLFAPPFGLGYYAACTIGRVNPDAALGRIWPYLGVLTAALVLVALVPWLSTGFLAR